MIDDELDDYLYKTAGVVATETTWPDVKKLIECSKLDIKGCDESELEQVFNRHRRRLSDQKAQNTLPPTPDDTPPTSLKTPSNCGDRRSGAPKTTETKGFIRAINTRQDSPADLLDEEMCTLSHQEPEDGDGGYYITDQICEIFCGPPHIGEEVEFAYQWIGETEIRRGRFIVKRLEELPASVVCPRDNPEDNVFAEDAHSDLSQPNPVPLSGLPFASEKEKMEYDQTAGSDGFQKFLSSTLAGTYTSAREETSDPSLYAIFTLRTWRCWKYLPKTTHPKINPSG